MAVDVPEVEEVKKLLEELDEKALIARLDSFVRLNEGLESKKGKEFIEVSILGFLEGILMVMRRKYPEDTRVEELYEKVKARRSELDEQFRKPRIPYLEGE
ncbi:DUF3216 domain-containing protein [Thermococcus gorgonarius]|uniref:Methyltransferase n=1 Tax=Thermococcus gorgonarius TaxID=71997 RepID=A0A2Z2M8V0_THEGO|nr:DUF3216 domain-containing protein [Thermococcus gorgonarius]ASJ00324.1 methyltransferase [Thermococcus gorgonarius]